MPNNELNASEVFPNEAKNLQTIAALVKAEAQQSAGNIEELLGLLRSLEALHREIRDGLFQEALPTSRQALHRLLRELESEGGWPYIPRMRVQAIMKKLDSGAG